MNTPELKRIASGPLRGLDRSWQPTEDAAQNEAASDQASKPASRPIIVRQRTQTSLPGMTHFEKLLKQCAHISPVDRDFIERRERDLLNVEKLKQRPVDHTLPPAFPKAGGAPERRMAIKRTQPEAAPPQGTVRRTFRSSLFGHLRKA